MIKILIRIALTVYFGGSLIVNLINLSAIYSVKVTNDLDLLSMFNAMKSRNTIRIMISIISLYLIWSV